MCVLGAVKYLNLDFGDYIALLESFFSEQRQET